MTAAGAVGGLVVGTALGFAVALMAAAASAPRLDGTYAMRQMIICLPVGAVLGLMAGAAWGLTTSVGQP